MILLFQWYFVHWVHIGRHDTCHRYHLCLGTDSPRGWPAAAAASIHPTVLYY